MKVIIIGASTPGLFTAYLLAKGGVEVEVYERMSALGWPPRTIIVTSKLSEILDFIPEEAIINQINYLELFSKSSSGRVVLSCPDLVIERRKLIELLARLAAAAGARIILGHQFEGLARFGKKIVVGLKDLETKEERQVPADILVGADGTLSAVSRAVSRNGHHLAALIQARVYLPDSGRNDTCKVWFVSDQTKYFYWLIPESNEAAVVGLIAEDVHRAKASLMGFLQERQLQPLDFQSALVPMHRFEYRGNVLDPDGNIFFVGDAAAQVKTTTVGGVVTGLYGARAVANAILNGKNDHGELRRLKRELNLHLLVRQILNRFSNENYDELIQMLGGGLKEVVEGWTRDELLSSFWRLIWKEPRLITLGAKALLSSILP